LRKQHKKTLAELFATLKEANAELPKPENSAIIGEWVKSIKEFTEVIKNYINANISDEVANKELAVHGLEIYTEKICEDVDQTLFKNLKQQLHNIEIEINKFQVTQLEIVFIVSSAAKSDSLLPVYEAAATDPASIVRWMPVPLRKSNVDRKIIGEDFDGPENYLGIECTDYRTYNFEQNHPDVIFTNDIYDGGNFVSALPPFFWAENLKKFTDCLVYIPYFTMGNNLTERSFVQYPNMLFVDLVIVESEKVRKLYVEAAMELFGINYDYKRIIALGSPKYDNALKANELHKKGLLEIPEEWRRKIYRGDGSKKKVVFFNTSLTNMLNDVNKNDSSYLPGSGYLKNVKKSIELFSNNENTLLLWRPHPLFIDTIKSMRPWLYNEWIEIVSSFIDSDIGIFDDSGSIDSAIAVSDVLYGDKSSICVIFEILNKNIMDYLTKAADLLLSRSLLYAYCLDETYVKSSDNAMIFTLDTETMKFSFVDFLCGEDNTILMRSMKCVSCDNKMYYLPGNDTTIRVFDVNKKSTESYELDIEPAAFTRQSSKINVFFNCGYFYKDKLFMFPFYYNNIVSYDFSDKKMTVCLNLDTILSSISYPKETQIFNICTAIDDDRVVLPFLRSNHILIYSLSDNSYVIKKIGMGKGFAGAYLLHDELILVENYRPCIWFLNKSGEALSSFTDFPADLRHDGSGPFFSNRTAVFVNESLYLFSIASNMSVKINLHTKKCERITELDKYAERGKNIVFILAYYDEKTGKIILNEFNSKRIIVFDPVSLKTTETNTGDLGNISCNIEAKALETYVKSISSSVNDETAVTVSPCADKIYNYIKSRVL
jgi:hypothetical protein